MMVEQQTRSMRVRSAFRQIIAGNAVLSLLAIVLALVVGAILIIATDPSVQEAARYFFYRPSTFFSAAGSAVGGAYLSLLQGAFYNPLGSDLAMKLRPIADTLTFATPLAMAGLGVAITFRSGLFNIGGRGQMIMGAAFAGWAGFTLDLPPVVHLVVAVLAGMAGGALWAGIAGVLKAYTGASEVITTIMLNYIAFYLIAYLLRTPVLQAPGSNNPQSAPIRSTAEFFPLLGERFPLHFGFILALVATALTWWLLDRSALGFRLRAVGLNPRAARVAGMNVGRLTILAMLLSGALVGLAGANQALSTAKGGFSSGVDAGIGFEAITVALLGRSKPWGVFAAALLFGALRAGGFSMQASQGIPVDLVLVLQSLIVLFIAAPPLIRAVFRLPSQEELREVAEAK